MPSVEHDRRLATLFDAALAVDTEHRNSFLDTACRDAPALRQELDALLQPRPSLDTNALFPLLFGAESDTPEAPAPRGTRLGPYTVIDELGHGGMGVVYLAERDDDAFQRRVAIKLLRPEVSTRPVIQRFLRERQILAALNHPNIARLYDGGTTADGRPYLVMEYVDGKDIVTYCRTAALDLRARLRLFQIVCTAVQYAHDHLVVHRDLKPSNILVTADGAVKLMDFGIAKLLTPTMGVQDVHLTRTGARLMTPEYAAPEQIRGERVTATTDVYALGVLLYELLAGCRPFDLQGRTFSEMEQILCETPPRPPSTRPRTSDAVPSSAPLALPPRLLRGDLDTIVLTALQKAPTRRYASVATLAADVERHLTRQPIAARPDSALYRASRFASRHRVGVGISAAVLLLCIGFAAFYAVQITTERDRAQGEAQKAEQALAFLVDVFEQADPAEARGAEITARELLDAGTARIAADLATQPDIQAVLYTATGRVYGNLGLYPQADSLLQAALRLQSADADPSAYVVRVSALANIRRNRGFLVSADSLYWHARRTARRHLPAPHPVTANVLNDHALLVQERGEPARADSMLHAALDLRRTLLPPDHVDVARSYNDLALSKYVLGDMAATETYLADALAIRRTALGNDHPTVAETLNNLAVVQATQGAFHRAQTTLAEAIRIRTRVLGPDHPRVLTSQANLGSIYRHTGNLAAADSVFTDVLARRRQLLGTDHPDVATVLNNLALVKQAQGRTAAAESLYAETHRIQTAHFGPQHLDVARTLNNWASLVHDAGVVRADPARLAQAERLYREALAARQAVLGDHEETAVSHHNLATLLNDRDDVDGAVSHLRAAHGIYRRTSASTPDAPLRTVALLALTLLRHADRFETARTEADTLLASVETARADLEPSVAAAVLDGTIGESYLLLGRYATAEGLLRSHYDALVEARGPDGRYVDLARARLDTLYRRWGRPDGGGRAR